MRINRRNRLRRRCAVVLVACALGSCRDKPPVANTLIGVEKTQLVTVVTDGWNGFRAELRRYERVLIAQARTSEKMDGERLDALGAMLKQLREEIAMLERQYVRAA